MKLPLLKIKVLLCLTIILTGFRANAQDGKPTKEETIEFINDFLQSQEDNELACSIYRKSYDAAYKTRILHGQAYLLPISSGNTVMLVSLCAIETDWLGKEEQLISHEVLLNKVEEIQIVGIGYRDDDGSGECGQYGLYFKEKGGKDWTVDSGYLPLWKGVSSEGTNKYKETQIYKAFEHLRKLVGAPEPLKFD